MSRKNYKKVTTVSKDIFGNKQIETQWVPTGGGGVVIILIVLLLLFARGCG